MGGRNAALKQGNPEKPLQATIFRLDYGGLIRAD
jgi:hypothetical protein